MSWIIVIKLRPPARSGVWESEESHDVLKSHWFLYRGGDMEHFVGTSKIQGHEGGIASVLYGGPSSIFNKVIILFVVTVLRPRMEFSLRYQY